MDRRVPSTAQCLRPFVAVPSLTLLIWFFLGPSAWDLQWCTHLGAVPSDPVVESCGLSGSGDDREDLRALCALGGNGSACAQRASLASSVTFAVNGHRISTRRRRQNLLVFPSGGWDETCSGTASLPFVNVVVMHDIDNGCRFNVHSEWITSQILPSLGLPLRVVQAEPGVTEWPAMLSNSLVVVSAFSGVRFDLAEYGRIARSRGVVRMGLLHCNHEITWQTGHNEELMRFLTYENRHYLEAYAHFDFVLRFHYSPTYARLSAFLPAGTSSAYLAEAQGEPPEASRRPVLCTAAVGHVHSSYRMDRELMHHALEQAPGLCQRPQLWGSEYVAALRSATFSLCPFGTQEETFRVYESVLAGALVVLTRASFVELELKAPFVVLESWSQLPQELERLRRNTAGLDELQRVQRQWFLRYMRDVQARIRALADQTYRQA